ncbi:MAG: serine hydrolase, partial [Steroidobacteraceae bacterium]
MRLNQLLSLILAAPLTLIAATAPAQDTAVAAPAAPAGVALTTVDVDAWLDGYMPYALETGDIAGAVVAVVKDGAILTERGYG